jgi:hypothetical protein
MVRSFALAITKLDYWRQVNANLRGAATPTNFLTNIEYNEKGQRKSIEYGNGAITTYTYDPETFRLQRLTTAANGTNLPPGAGL